MALRASLKNPHTLAICAPLPVHDFLAPSFVQLSRRTVSTTSRCHSAAEATSPHPSSPDPRTLPEQLTGQPRYGPEAAAYPAPCTKPLTQAQRDFLSSALRVNQAGELAATLIYTHQNPRIIASYPHLRPLMKHMYDQEVGHFKTFNHLLAKHRVRPTAMYPVWIVAASALGWSTAVMGREAAMACTEAVETEIGGHYNEQVRYLLDMVDQMEKNGDEVSAEISDLIKTIRRIRDEELEHLDHAVENDAKEARPYELLTGIIKAGCRGAIWISERV